MERKNGGLQDRFIKEMRLNNISSMEEGNIFLEKYRSEHNLRFGKEALKKEDAHRPAKEDQEGFFAIKEERKLSKNLTFQYDNEIYQIRVENPSWSLKYATVRIIDQRFKKTQVEYKGKSLPYAKWHDLPVQGRVVDSKALHWIEKNIS